MTSLLTYVIRLHFFAIQHYLSPLIRSIRLRHISPQSSLPNNSIGNSILEVWEQLLLGSLTILANQMDLNSLQNTLQGV